MLHSSSLPLLTLLLLLTPPVLAAPQIELIHQESVVLRFHALSAEASLEDSQAAHEIVVDPTTGGSVKFQLNWPTPQSSCTLKIDAEEVVAPPGERHKVRLSAELLLADGVKVTAHHELSFSEPGTSLFEIYRHLGNSLTLVIETAVIERTLLPAPPKAGRPVLFVLEIQWVEGSETVSLESNQLNSFVGRPISYSFKLGDTAAADALRIELKPLRITGNLMELEVELAGTIPSEQGLEMVARRESLIVSKHASSVVTLTSGEPPRGYRFVITTVF